jgi:hypothetical protein
MENIEQYKKRFYNLMESTMGDAKPLLSEQINKPYFVDKESVYHPPSGYGGGNGLQTVRGTQVWLNNYAQEKWPSGDVEKAKASASKLVKALDGLDFTGSGAELAQEVANEWKSFNILTQNEFLRQWWGLVKGKDWSSPWAELDNDNESSIASQMISDSIDKVKNYCKSYVDEKNNGKNTKNVVCDLFVTNDLRAPGWS